MASQRKFTVIGFMFTIIFMVRLAQYLQSETASVVELINLGSLAFMAYAIGHLYPQFKQRDERVDAIKQKGMYLTVFIVLVGLIALMGLIQFNIIKLTALEMIRVIISLVIITIWSCWLIFSKRM